MQEMFNYRLRGSGNQQNISFALPGSPDLRDRSKITSHNLFTRGSLKNNFT